MESLKIENSAYTPEIDFDAGENSLKILGKSTPENTFEFFEPVKNWLNNYFETPKECVVTFDVPYFNSSSSRVMYDLFDIFSDAKDGGSNITINWEYATNNENAEESGEEFKEDFEDLTINLVAKD